MGGTKGLGEATWMEREEQCEDLTSGDTHTHTESLVGPQLEDPVPFTRSSWAQL